MDATIGAGYLLIHSALPRYERNGNDYERIGSTFGRLMPTIGLGAGYQFDKVSVFSRYEMKRAAESVQRPPLLTWPLCAGRLKVNISQGSFVPISSRRNIYMISRLMSGKGGLS